MSFWRPIPRGAARAFDLFGALVPSLDDIRHPGETGARADARALASDWRAVGDDLRAVMRAHPPAQSTSPAPEARGSSPDIGGRRRP